MPASPKTLISCCFALVLGTFSHPSIAGQTISNEPGTRIRSKLSQAELRLADKMRLSMNNARPIRQFGKTYLYLGELALSDDLSHAISINPFAPWAYSVRGFTGVEIEKATRLVEAALSNADSPQSSYARAWTRHRSYDHSAAMIEKAVADCEQTLKREPKFVDALLLEADCLLDANNLQAALGALDRAAKIAPSDSRVYLAKGIAYAKEKQFDRALKELDTAITLAPDRFWYHWTRGYVALDAGQDKQALQDFLKGSKQHADNICGLAALENYYYRLSQHEKAAEALSKLIAEDPKSADLFFARGSTYKRLSDYEKARQDLSKALQLKPRFLDALLYRAYAEQRLSDHKAAIADYAAAQQIKCTTTAFKGMAASYIELGDYKKAADSLSQSIKLSPDAKALKARSACYEKLKQPELAAADRKRARDMEIHH